MFWLGYILTTSFAMFGYVINEELKLTTSADYCSKYSMKI